MTIRKNKIAPVFILLLIAAVLTAASCSNPANLLQSSNENLIINLGGDGRNAISYPPADGDWTDIYTTIYLTRDGTTEIRSMHGSSQLRLTVEPGDYTIDIEFRYGSSNATVFARLEKPIIASVKAGQMTRVGGTAALNLDEIEITGVNVYPQTVTAEKGSTRQFTAAVITDIDLILQMDASKFDWSVGDSTMTPVSSSINTNGLLTVKDVETANTLYVIAKLKNDNSKSGEATVNVATITTGTPTYDVANYSDWSTAVLSITAGASGAIEHYIINITNGFSMTGINSSTFTGQYIDVTINGNGKTITLSSNGSLLQVGANQTVTMNNLILVGKSDNDATLVNIDGGELIMNGGAIKDNKFTVGSAPYGGAVRIINGAFTMNGGTISGNTASNGAGGIYISGDNISTFRVSNGTIYGNDETDTTLRNTYTITYGSGAALVVSGIPKAVEHGIFNADEDWVLKGNLSTTNDTIEIIDGEKQP